MKKISVALLILLFTQIGCKDDEPTVNIVLPTNLEVEIIHDEEIEGRIEVKATAFDENYFTISFEDGENSEVIETNDGKVSHTYTVSGVYTIITRAHITAADYIERTDTVHIDREPSTNSDGIPTKGYTSPLSYDNYNLVWQDEFDGNTLNTSDWNFELGTGNNGWGNNELQYYTKENTSVGGGYLTITAKKQELGGQSYTSSRLTTQGKKSFKYGRIDIRAALPKGQGMWPALWMLGDNHSSVGWPRCGEIDIMEIVGGSSNGNSDKQTHGTLHWDNNGDYASYGGSTFTSKTNFNEEFHVFSIIWDENSINWLLDGNQFHAADITPGHMSEFRDKFFFIFNVAVGGNWPGDPDASTQFPQKMHVDYVRVFQK
ncbi:MAG: glycoside hydrolase family 16 protein [Bacteroidia bacterium]